MVLKYGGVLTHAGRKQVEIDKHMLLESIDCTAINAI